MTRTAALAALVLATVTGSAALAASEAQIAKIERFASGEVTGLSDGEVATVLNVINSGDTQSEKRALVDNLLGLYR